MIGASENAAEMLNLPLRLVLGATLEAVVEREVNFTARSLPFRADAMGAVEYLGAFRVREDLYSLLTHVVNGMRVLECWRTRLRIW